MTAQPFHRTPSAKSRDGFVRARSVSEEHSLAYATGSERTSSILSQPGIASGSRSSVDEVKSIIAEALHFAAGIFPTVGVGTDVPHTQSRIDQDGDADLPGAFAESVILAEIPIALSSVVDHRREPRHERFAELLVASGQLQLPTNLLKSDPSGQNEAETGVADFEESA
jgi:hypothetical protein